MTHSSRPGHKQGNFSTQTHLASANWDACLAAGSLAVMGSDTKSIFENQLN